MEENIVEVLTEPSDLEEVRAGMEDDGYNFTSGDVVMIPQNTIKLAEKSAAKKVLKLMDALDEHDDVQDVYSNFDIDDELMAELEATN